MKTISIILLGAGLVIMIFSPPFFHFLKQANMYTNEKPLMDRRADCISKAFYLDKERADELIKTVLTPLVQRAFTDRLSSVEVLVAVHDGAEDNQEYAWLAQGVFSAIEKERKYRRVLQVEKGARLLLGLSDDDDVIVESLI